MEIYSSPTNKKRLKIRKPLFPLVNNREQGIFILVSKEDPKFSTYRCTGAAFIWEEPEQVKMGYEYG